LKPIENSSAGRIEQALDRLGAAVERLEHAGRTHVQGQGSAEESARIERLNAELAAMRQDYESLQLTSQKATGRIDAAIGRLKAVLEA